MIYSPNHYKENRSELIYQIIKEYSFATIITQSADGPFISHLPLLLESNDGKPALLGHCAKANPQWMQFAAGEKVTAIFHGPNSYISPAWYQPKADNVPTWNYATVHARGTASITSTPEEAFDVLQRTTHQFETEYKTGWELPEEPNEELNHLLRHIVAFRIEVENIQAKFKLSQKQNSLDRNNVIENLSKMSKPQREVAKLMRDVMKESSE